MNQRNHTNPGDDEAQSSIVYFDELELTSHTTGHTVDQWQEPERLAFTRSQKENTTILFGGLAHMHDRLLEAGLKSLGYRARALNCPDKEAMQTGKEFGNRGQCNPTYFTVGNLVKHLIDLRDNQGMHSDDIINNHIFLTAGGCGPCRFGMYSTEYRKALRDAGFPDFRIRTFQQDLNNADDELSTGLTLDRQFYLRIIDCVMIADVLNLLGYRIRPYEVNAGDTDAALAQCEQIIGQAIANNSGTGKALKHCKQLLGSIKVDRLQPKPKVSIIGEFWAMTTEGDGNYHLQRFLESEGAECDIQPITNWLLYMLWSEDYDTVNNRQAQKLQSVNTGNAVDRIWKKRLLIKAGDVYVKYRFYHFARKLGLSNYHLADMDEIAELAGKHYHRELRGGEGHMEVGKLIQTFQHNKAHLVISVKPFGCMPSSSVSDGVQTIITKLYPGVQFLPIETSGDGEVNIYSRIQMSLFKARKNAQQEYDTAVQASGMNSHELERRLLKNTRAAYAGYAPRRKVAGSAANIVYSL